MTTKSLKIYVAGKVSKDSSFGGHHWRDSFCRELANLAGIKIENIDPLSQEGGLTGISQIFEKDCQLINEAEALVVYLSDDISVGGSQEILIARYLRKPVIALAPAGGKFNGAKREMLGRVIENYQDPFVFSTCDVVCASVEEVARALKNVKNIQSSGLEIIDSALKNS